MIKYIKSILCIFLLVSCIKSDLLSRRNYALKLASNANMNLSEIETDFFTITTYSKITNKEYPINLYIEGDGFSWVKRNLISKNPTPKFPLALELAALDNTPNVIYMARPCQYTKFKREGLCETKYWSEYRFSEKVINSMNQAINILTKGLPKPLLNLIGYSGGGGIATIIASRRNDINSIRTVGGNLDHIVFNNYHHVSPMTGSINPSDIAFKISNIPQNHFIGIKDDVMPQAVLNNFIKKTQNDKCIKVIFLENASHTKGWKNNWLNLLNMSFLCKK